MIEDNRPNLYNSDPMTVKTVDPNVSHLVIRKMVSPGSDSFPVFFQDRLPVLLSCDHGVVESVMCKPFMALDARVTQ
jgi:hypothetical protein